jgi:hypothetical protein
MAMMSKAELIEGAYEMTAGNVKDLSLEQLERLMTVTQFVTDLCLNEIEFRGELRHDAISGIVIVPYVSEHRVQTVLTGGPSWIKENWNAS